MSARTTLKTQDHHVTSAPWRPPTRRAFVSMLGAAAAALAVRGPTGLVPELEARERGDTDRPRRTAARTTRWVGHC